MMRKGQIMLGVVLTIMLVASCLTVETVEARDSVFTRRGAGRLYWISYEYQYTHNSYLPEDVWKANIDWIADKFLEYGYDTVCTDGWIEGSTRHTSNGYIISHHDSWVHDWSYWADYCRDKGLQLGVYYNPLWVTPSARNDSNCKIIGTDYPVRSITNDNDVFDGGQPTVLYWVDVTKPGAEQFVKGYIDYFKNCGVKFLRVDFLSWYEDGTDHGRMVGLPHGTENYNTALRWMKEAAGDDLELSLVMPHLKNHGQTELKYGDMIRINEDCGDGGWYRLSDMDRGNHRDHWSQYANAFDGFTFFADISGRGQMILDGDMLRLNTFSTDAEKRSAVSIMAMAGSPINIADQYNTIGSNGPFYQNTEILALNKAGFAGKPLSYDPRNADSQRWVGQLPNGDWVIALFNREWSAQYRSIDFCSDLGIGGKVAVRDLWSHVDLGQMLSYGADIPSHDCKILKVTNNIRRYEAEVAAMSRGAKKNTNHAGYSGPGFVDEMEAVGAKVLFGVQVDTAGEYNLKIRYANAMGSVRTVSLYVNDVKHSQLNLANLPNWDSWGYHLTTASLNAGLNTIAIQYDPTDTAFFNLDYIEVFPGTLIPLSNPGFEDGGLSGWTEWHPHGQGPCYGVDSYDAHNGRYKLYFWSESPYQQSAHQIVTGLANGSYMLRAWVKASAYGGQPSYCRMEALDHGADTYMNMIVDGKWREYSSTFEVTNGQLDIGFYVASPGSTSMQIDDVELIKN